MWGFAVRDIKISQYSCLFRFGKFHSKAVVFIVKLKCISNNRGKGGSLFFPLFLGNDLAVYIYIYILVCIYIYIYRERERERES